MVKAINESIMEFYRTAPWGYKTFFYLCAKNRCHPNYLTDYQKEFIANKELITEKKVYDLRYIF